MTRREVEPSAGKEPRVAVFLDRDGTVIHDRHYLSDPAGVELIPGAADAVLRLNRAGVPVILVTNQSGIGRGLFSEAKFLATNARLVELLAAEGAGLDAVYHCPHAPDEECDCRKPAPGLFLQAASEHGLDLSRSFFVGDRARDVAPAARFGGTPILVASGDVSSDATPPGTLLVESLTHAVREILRQLAD